ncbi:MAG: aldehyde dehydrogenase family protein, partial [Gemmatimonadaceae bacterium]|nr:aldehyde dehydrogenase family protein [Gemmatimonadaceae bacterium]
MPFLNFIGGQWVPAASGKTFTNTNPADTRDVIGTFPLSGAADVEAAVASAKRGFAQWKATPAPARGDILRRVGDLLASRKDALADLMTREMGKPVAETKGDVQEGIDTAFYAATEGNVGLFNCFDKVGPLGFVPRALDFVYPLKLVKTDPADQS